MDYRTEKKYSDYSSEKQIGIKHEREFYIHIDWERLTRIPETGNSNKKRQYMKKQWLKFL